jgi:hypothetical protein
MKAFWSVTVLLTINFIRLHLYNPSFNNLDELLQAVINVWLVMSCGMLSSNIKGSRWNEKNLTVLDGCHHHTQFEMWFVIGTFASEYWSLVEYENPFALWEGYSFNINIWQRASDEIVIERALKLRTFYPQCILSERNSAILLYIFSTNHGERLLHLDS